jgi:hypothetical protein
MQRVSDSWRSTMGSTAITVVLAFCNEHPDLKNSDINRQEFAKNYLEDFRFLYHKSEGEDVKVSNTNIYQLFFCYFNEFYRNSRVLSVAPSYCKPLLPISTPSRAMKRSLDLAKVFHMELLLSRQER